MFLWLMGKKGEGYMNPVREDIVYVRYRFWRGHDELRLKYSSRRVALYTLSEEARRGREMKDRSAEQVRPVIHL